MFRLISKDLDLWLRAQNRKPLVLRGTRQVGKTWLIRDLAARHHIDLIELNFERSPNLLWLKSASILPSGAVSTRHPKRK